MINNSKSCNLKFEIKTLDQVDKDLFTKLWNESHLDHFHNWEKSKEEIYLRNKIFGVCDKLSKVAVLIQNGDDNTNNNNDDNGQSNGKLIGFILSAVGEINSKRVGWNAATAVVKEYRGMGVATKLYQSILEDYKKNGIEEAVLELISINERAFKLYSKLGFKVTSNHTILNSKLDPLLLKINNNDNDCKIEFQKVSEPNEFHLNNQSTTTQFQNLLMHNFNLINIIGNGSGNCNSSKEVVGFMYYSLSYDKKTIIFHQLYLKDNSLIVDSTFSSIFKYFFSKYGDLNLTIYCWDLNNQITKFIIEYNNQQFKKSYDYNTMKLKL